MTTKPIPHHPVIDGIVFLWTRILHPTAAFIVSGLDWLAHWFPSPYQERFLVLTHRFEPFLAFSLIPTGMILFWVFVPRRWYGWVPERACSLVSCFTLLPLLLFALVSIVLLAGCALFLVTGWKDFGLCFGTINLLICLFVGILAWGYVTTGETKEVYVRNTSHGSASWQSLEAAQDLGRVALKGYVLGNSYGFALGHMPGTDPKTYDSRLRYMGHVLTCAPTGAGKGIGAVIPNLLEYPGSALVLDIKGENYAVTRRARQRRKNEVFLIDPFGVTGDSSHCLNWLDFLDPNDPNVVSESTMLADMMVISDSRDGSYWDDAARDLIRGLLIHVAGFSENERNMGTVRRLLTGGEARLNLVLQEMTATTAGFGVVSRAAHSFLLKADRERSGVLSTAIRHTAFLDDPRIVECLSRSDFDLRDIKRKRMTVFVALPPSKLSAYNRFLRAIVGLSLAAVTNDNQPPEYNVVFFLDEFGQLGRMSAIEDAVSLVRGYSVAFWLFVQDLSQLKGVYPKWQTFLANTAKQFFGTSDLETARYISSALGSYTTTYHTTSLGAQHSTSSEHRASRSLLTPDEVMQMGSHRPIVLIGGERPYILDRLNYLQDKAYEGLAEENPFHQKQTML